MGAKMRGAMAVHAKEQHITRPVRTGRNGVRLELSAQELEQAGIQPGEGILLEVRRYTVEDWRAEGEGTVFSSDEFLAHLDRCPVDRPS